MSLSPTDFGTSFKSFMEQMSASAPAEETHFRQKLAVHFGQEPRNLPTLTETYPAHDHANLQMAIDAEFGQPDYSVSVTGVINSRSYFGVTLSNLVAPAGTGLMRDGAPTEGPVQYVNLKLGEDRTLACVKSGLFLIKYGNESMAALISSSDREFRSNSEIGIQVMAQTKKEAEGFLGRIRTLMRRSNVYRGHVLSLTESRMGELSVRFHQLTEVDRTDIILPEGLLERVERETIRFSELSEQMAAAGRHLKRGILLHGPPGTGKTLTAMYVAQAMKDRTVLLLTGRGHGLLERSCEMARMLQPSVLILEDVDLIAEDRSRSSSGCVSPLLFTLLNQMDGLSDDADVLFLLTTNRPEILEPALSARPGRVDQTIKVALPDTECRRRLFDLYSANLTLGDVSWDNYIDRTMGASAAFIRELMRKATLFALDDSGSPMADRHLDTALHELVVEGGMLTRKVLGFGTDSLDA